MKDRLKPAVGYIRMSTDQQQDSPARQRRDIAALAERQGYRIIDTITRSTSNSTLGFVSVRFFRYRRPSLNTLLGTTKAKKRVKKELGITAAMKRLHWLDENETAGQANNRP